MFNVQKLLFIKKKLAFYLTIKLSILSILSLILLTTNKTKSCYKISLLYKKMVICKKIICNVQISISLKYIIMLFISPISLC